MGGASRMIDLHNHLLYDLDDGPRTLQESLQMCEIGYRNGIRTIVATPHTLSGIHQNNRSTILAKVQELTRVLEETGLTPLSILPGADIHLSPEIIPQLDQGKLTTLGDTGKSLLIEFPSQGIPRGTEELLLGLIKKGITPVITHPERNLEIMGRPQRYHEMIRIGCLGQVTAASLTGGFGAEVRRCAEELLKRRLLHVIATDAHSAHGRSPILTPAVEAAKRIVGEEEARRMVTEYPRAVLEGQSPQGL